MALTEKQKAMLDSCPILKEFKSELIAVLGGGESGSSSGSDSGNTTSDSGSTTPDSGSTTPDSGNTNTDNTGGSDSESP